MVKKNYVSTFAQEAAGMEERTSSQREATHFVMVRRQGRPIMFVPVTVNPFSKGNKSEYDSARKRKMGQAWGPRDRNPRAAASDSARGAGAFDKGGFVQSLRKIRNRGVASKGFLFLQGSILPQGGERKGIQIDPTGRTSGKLRKVVRRFTQSWKNLNGNRPSIHYRHNMNHVTSHWPGIDGKLTGVAAHNLQREITARLARRTAGLNKARGRTA